MTTFNTRSIKLISLVLLSVLAFLLGCGDSTPEPDNGKIDIVATTTMIADLARQIGGEQVSVQGLMGPGIDPHLYKASEGDVTKLAKAELILFNGLHLEGKMAEVLENMDGMGIRSVALAETLEDSLLISSEQFQGNVDPHVWFDITLWMKVASSMVEVLGEMDPANFDLYRNRFKNGFFQEASDLHEFTKIGIASIPEGKRVLVTAHDAFGYFGRAYGMDVRGLQGISTASEAGTADVQALSQFIADNEIPSLFVESSVPPRNIEAVQAAVKSRGFDVEIGGSLYSDALGHPGTPEESYQGTIRHNVNTIVAGLTK